MTVVAHGSANRLLVRQCLWLAGVTVALWLLLAIPAWLTSRADALEGLSYAALLCLVPGWAVFFLASRCADKGARTLVIVAGGMLLRFVFIMVGLLTIPTFRPRLGFREFVVWLIVVYLATLLVETLYFVTGNQNGDHFEQARC